MKSVLLLWVRRFVTSNSSVCSQKAGLTEYPIMNQHSGPVQDHSNELMSRIAEVLKQLEDIRQATTQQRHDFVADSRLFEHLGCSTKYLIN